MPRGVHTQQPLDWSPSGRGALHPTATAPRRCGGARSCLLGRRGSGTVAGLALGAEVTLTPPLYVSFNSGSLKRQTYMYRVTTE